MCLILFAYQVSPDLPFVVAANRDELYARPAQPAHFWEEPVGLLAGRDASAGGTWLGVNRNGRFAAVTNFADSAAPDTPRSRGALTASFLGNDASSADFAHQIVGPDYRGFNLLLWDGVELLYTSNQGVTRVLEPGYYGLSNAELGAQWPKVVRGVQRLRTSCQANLTADDLIRILHDDEVPPDEQLPHRGRPIEMERNVAPCFIRGEQYGTRASTAVIYHGRHLTFVEQLYDPGGLPKGRVSFDLDMDGVVRPDRGPYTSTRP